MQHRDVGIGPFLPADDDPAETVQPTVGSLNDPAPSFEPGCTLDRIGLLAARTNVRGEPELRRELAHLVVVVALVETKPDLMDLMWVTGEAGRARFRRSKDGSWRREPGRCESRKPAA